MDVGNKEKGNNGSETQGRPDLFQEKENGCGMNQQNSLNQHTEV